jgi:RNA polymerase sigma factor (TIGR02999 family)
MNDVTLLLHAAHAGDHHASEQLLPLVYEELRRLAEHRLNLEGPGQTLEPTALVHEAYLRLVGEGEGAQWGGRDHFFAAAAQCMRRILVENARRKHSLKRGGGLKRRELDEAELLAPELREDLLALDNALTELAETDRAAAELVQLRYFGDLSMPEAARILGLSQRTAERLWTYARAWLRERIVGTSSKDDDMS